MNVNRAIQNWKNISDILGFHWDKIKDLTRSENHKLPELKWYEKHIGCELFVDNTHRRSSYPFIHNKDGRDTDIFRVGSDYSHVSICRNYSLRFRYDETYGLSYYIYDRFTLDTFNIAEFLQKFGLDIPLNPMEWTEEDCILIKLSL